MAKLMVKDENLLGGRKEADSLVFTGIYQGNLHEHTVEGLYPNSFNFLMNNYPLGWCQILQASHDVTLISLKSPRNTYCGGPSTSQYCDIKIVI